MQRKFFQPKLLNFLSSSYARSINTYTVINQLTTKIFAPNQVEVPVHIKHYNQKYFAQLIDNSSEQVIGYLRYKIKPDHLYVSYLQNSTACNPGFSYYSHVGAALHEFIFRNSVELGKQGKIHLFSLNPALYFHYNVGYRPFPETKPSLNMTPSIGPHTKEILTVSFKNYLLAPTDFAEQEIRALLTKLGILRIMEKTARVNLNRAEDQAMTFVEFIQASFKEINITKIWEEKFQNALQNNKIVNTDTEEWKSQDMYLPSKTITEKLKLFGLNAGDQAKLAVKLTSNENFESSTSPSTKRHP